MGSSLCGGAVRRSVPSGSGPVNLEYMVTPKLKELLKRAMLDPGKAVVITGEEEKELLELVALLEKSPQITTPTGEVN